MRTKGEKNMADLTIEMGMIRQGFEREDLLTYIAKIDADASGENGPDYLLPQAKEAGYLSNADMWVSVAMELYQETEAIVRSVMTSLISTWMDYCRYYDFETLKLPNGDVTIAFANAD